MTRRTRSALVRAAATLALLATAACNTVEGVGRDISGAGDVIEDAASRTKRAISN